MLYLEISSRLRDNHLYFIFLEGYSGRTDNGLAWCVDDEGLGAQKDFSPSVSQPLK